MNALEMVKDSGEKIVKRYSKFRILDRHQVRAWVDNLPEDKDNSLLSTWGLIIAAIIEKDKNKSSVIYSNDLSIFKNPLAFLFDRNIDTGDAFRIKKYLEYIQSLSSDRIMEQDFAKSSKKPIYDALMQVAQELKSIDNEVHPVLEILLSMSWTPTCLLKKLDEKRFDQIKYLHDMWDEHVTIVNTAQGMLLQAFIPLFSTGRWISTHSIFEQLWDVIEVNPLSGFVYNMALTHPNTTERALKILYNKQHQMPDALVEEFFPLNFENIPAKNILDVLWPLWMLEDQTSERTKKLFKKHHPDITQLLDLQLLLFAPTPYPHEPASILIRNFEKIISKDCTEDDSLIFTDFEIMCGSN